MNAYIIHSPFDATIYTGRAEPYESELAQYWYQHIQPSSSTEKDADNHTNHSDTGQPIVTLLGFGCDQGVQRNQGRIGAKHAPNVIKSAFGKLPISRHTQSLSAPLSVLVADAGNVLCQDGDIITDGMLEAAQAAYAQRIAAITSAGSTAIGIGGGHEIALASFMGLHQALNQTAYQATNQTLDQTPDQAENQAPNHHTKDTPSQTVPRIGIINLDAHFDLRHDCYATSGTPFRQISEHLDACGERFYYLPIGISDYGNTAALFAKAKKLGVHSISESDCHRLPFSDITDRIDDFIAQVDAIYLTLDLDVLQAGYMPAVSAVNASGLSVDFVERCISHIIATGKVRLLDIAEFNPSYDIDGRGAKVAGRLLAGMLGGIVHQRLAQANKG